MRPKKTLIAAAVATALSAAMLPVEKAAADTGRLESHVAAQDLDLTAEEETLGAGAGQDAPVHQAEESHSRSAGGISALARSGTMTALDDGADDGGLEFLHFAQAGPATTNPAIGATASGVGTSSLNGDSHTEPVLLDEVVVTAEKRAEPALSVPVPVTSLDASALVTNNQLRLQDYYAEVPGLQFNPSVQRSTPQIAIRGIIAGTGLSPTVGVTIDDVPYGSSSSNGGGIFVPDLDPSDLQRIEVLRGPQGTLYGANALGGLLKYVTADPEFDQFGGRIQASSTDVEHGDHAGYSVRGSVNVPITDSLAVRASGFSRRDPGYVDDPTYGQKGVNDADAYGAHIAALWKAAPDFSAKLSAFYQRTEQFGSAYADPSLSGELDVLSQSRLPFTGVEDKRTEAISLTLNLKLGPVDLVSLTGYSVNKITDVIDDSTLLSAEIPFLIAEVTGSTMPAAVGPVYSGGAEEFRTARYTQEFRGTMALTSSIDWLFGVFGSYETANVYQAAYYGNAAGLQALPTTFTSATSFLQQGFAPSDFYEYAAFTDFTFKITDRFDVQVGGRETYDRQSFNETALANLPGPLGIAAFPSSVTTLPEATANEPSFTYLFTPRYQLSSSVMLYSRIASGFRVGGINAEPAVLATMVPRTYGPDKTRNYEVGLKGDLLDKTLAVDLSVFYIDWSDVQVNGMTNGVSYIANAGRAKSDGVEFSTELRPIKGLTLGANATFDNAVLTSVLPNNSGEFALSGARLPYSARFTANFNAEEEFPLYEDVRGFAGGQLSYIGNRQGNFAEAVMGPRDIFPAYTQINVRGGVRWDTWSADIYVTNVADRRGILAGGVNGEIPPGEILYITPRTLGLALAKTF